MKKILPSYEKQKFWLKALSTSHQFPKIDLDEQIERNKSYLSHWFSPWREIDTDHHSIISDPLGYSTSVNQIDQYAVLLKEMFDRYMSRHYWAYNRQKITQKFWDSLLTEVDFHSFPNMLSNGMATEASDIRLMPTDLPVYPTEDSFTIDHFQMSHLNFNTPVKLLHRSLSKRWVFVVSGHVYGWVKATAVAKIDADQQSAYESFDSWVVLMEDGKDISDDKGWCFTSRVGQVLPLDGGHIVMAKKTIDGHTQIEHLSLSGVKHQPFPCPINQEHWFALINELMHKPYGWGDLYGMRDCSRLIVDLWSCFGYWIPRSSSEQANMVNVFTIPPKVGDRSQWLVEHAVSGQTILYMPGHVVLYMGEVDSVPMIFQSIWGPKNSSCWIGESAIMPLDFDSGLPGHYVNLVDRITRLILI